MTAGSRRLSALQWLRNNGGAIRGTLVTDELQVPVIHSEESDDVAREQAVAENIQRVPPTPVAEAKAFGEMAKRLANKEIAAHFGVPVKRVEQRLKLAALHPDVLKALDEGNISIAAAEAFTVEPDPQKQAAYLKKARSWDLDPGRIKQAFVQQLITGDSPVAKLIGKKKYGAARHPGASHPPRRRPARAAGRWLRQPRRSRRPRPRRARLCPHLQMFRDGTFAARAREVIMSELDEPMPEDIVAAKAAMARIRAGLQDPDHRHEPRDIDTVLTLLDEALLDLGLLHLVEEVLAEIEPAPACRLCGCTEELACYDDERDACHWVEENLCFHCKDSVALIEELVSGTGRSEPSNPDDDVGEIIVPMHHAHQLLKILRRHRG